jgi:hypothetical protein
MKGMKPTQALPGYEVPDLAYHGTDGDPFFAYFGTNLPLPDEACLTMLRDCWEKDTE